MEYGTTPTSDQIPFGLIMAKINDLKTKQVYSVRSGLELLRAYQIDPSLPLQFGCCNGQCGVCAIRVIEGEKNLSKPTKQEQLTLAEKKLPSPPYRLACQCAILGDITVDFTDCSMLRTHPD